MEKKKQPEASWLRQNLVPLLNLVVTIAVLVGGVFVYITFERQRQVYELERLEQQKPFAELTFDVYPLEQPREKGRKLYLVQPKISVENKGERAFEVAYFCLESFFGNIKEFPDKPILPINAFGPGPIQWKKQGESASCLESKCKEISKLRKNDQHQMGCKSIKKMNIDRLAGVYEGKQSYFITDGWLASGDDVEWIGARAIVWFSKGQEVVKRLTITNYMPILKAAKERNFEN